MEIVKLALYEKNEKTGILEELVNTYFIEENLEFLEKAYILKDDQNNRQVHLFLTIDRDVEDWEYEAIYDHYDGEKLENLECLCKEVEESYNPTWHIIFPYKESVDAMEEKLEQILQTHREMLQIAYEEIADKKEEYEN